MSEDSEKTPEWMVLLENKKKRHNRLAHEIGAGAPCLSCGDSCPGLDLHFWRKLCRNCKCKKEEHDVKDDEGYEQFEILLGPGSKRRTRGACLHIKVPEIQEASKNLKTAEVAFDWIPPNVTDDVAVEYMKQLPAAKLPISGSDGALYRRQQLERQVPIHDLDASRCHNLTPQEVEGLKQYLENLKSNVVGQGRVTKVPLHHAEVKWVSGEYHHKAIPASHAADSIRGIPPLPFSAPRPFQPAVSNLSSETDDDFPPPPPPLPNTLPPSLKKPSNFVPSWKSYRNPDSQIAYSETVPGKSTFVSAEHQRSGSAAADPVAQKNHHQRLRDAACQQYRSLPDESTTALPVDGTISMTMHPRNMSVSTTVPSVSPAMKAMALSQAHGASGTVNRESVPHTKDTSVPRTGAIIGSRYPSGEEHYPKLTGTELPQERNAIYSTHPGGKENSFSQQPGITSHSDAINVKNPSSVAHFTPYEETSALRGQKPYYTVQPMENTADMPVNFTAANADRQGITGAETSGGLKNMSVEKPFPTSHAAGGAREDVHRQQKGILAGSVGNGHDAFGMAEPLAAKSSIYSSLGPHGETVFSEGVPTDALPKSALAMQQNRYDGDISELAGHVAEMKTDDIPHVLQPEFNCKECKGAIQAGDVAVFADRAGQDVAWHPSCFVCTTCKELLVDLIYFFNKGKVYCGRHYAELLKIPRCFACDELIFVNEYTMAEGQAFHVKHFCCYECDIPLGGMKYVPVDGQPVCLDCFQEKYGKNCHACGKKIGASEQRVSWKELHWHVTGDCFSCFSCRKSLLGGRFVVKKNQPFCSKECVLSSGVL